MMEVVTQITCMGPIGRSFHGEVFINQRALENVENHFRMDCDLHKLGLQLHQFYQANQNNEKLLDHKNTKMLGF